jgi:hypothetical protein
MGVPASARYPSDLSTREEGERADRLSYQVDGIWGLITRNETLTDALVHGAIRRVGLVRKAGKVLWDEVFLEVFARQHAPDTRGATPGSSQLECSQISNWSDD